MSNLVVAAGEVILSSRLDPGVHSLDAYTNGVKAADGFLHEADASGSWWPAGCIAACKRLQACDRRFWFVGRFARSAYFGRTIAETVEQVLSKETPDARVPTIASLINIFITAFDGLCDEAPEFLPVVVPPLRELFAEFPLAPTAAAPSAHPVVALVLGAARSATMQLEPAIAASTGDLPRAFVGAVREAFVIQLDSVRPGCGGGELAVAERRVQVSRAAFRIAALVPALFHADAQGRAADLLAAGDALGTFFGWIDDLVDLEEDLRSGRENMVASRLRAHGHLDPKHPTHRTIEIIEGDAAMRWSSLRSALCRHRLWKPELEETLAIATKAWLASPA